MTITKFDSIEMYEEYIRKERIARHYHRNLMQDAEKFILSKDLKSMIYMNRKVSDIEWSDDGFISSITFHGGYKYYQNNADESFLNKNKEDLLRIRNFYLKCNKESPY